MNISRIFIERPVASSVLFVSILFFGWLGFRTLPVNDLPNVDFPTITVTATLPGASPEIMGNTVALPLERHYPLQDGLLSGFGVRHDDHVDRHASRQQDHR